MYLMAIFILELFAPHAAVQQASKSFSYSEKHFPPQISCLFLFVQTKMCLSPQDMGQFETSAEIVAGKNIFFRSQRDELMANLHYRRLPCVEAPTFRRRCVSWLLPKPVESTEKTDRLTQEALKAQRNTRGRSATCKSKVSRREGVNCSHNSGSLLPKQLHKLKF